LYGRAQITEATIDNAFGVVRRLTAADIEWLRANNPEISRRKVARLGIGLVELVKQIGDAQ
jgi:hypothetical protein